MLNYLLKRMLAMVPTLFGITLITFLIVELAPGDPVATQMGAGHGGASAEGGGGGEQDKRSDTINAKKKLLGMLREDFALFGFAPTDAAAPAAGVEVDALDRADLATLPSWAHAFAPAPDGSAIAVGGDDGRLATYDREGTLILAYTGHKGSVWAVALSAGHLVSAATDGTIVVHPVGAPAPAATIAGSGRPVRGVAFDPDGKTFLAVSDAGWIARYGLDGTELRRWDGHSSGATALAWAPDGKTFWTGGRDRALRRWDGATDAPAGAVEQAADSVIDDLAFSPDGTKLATGADDRMVRVFPVAADGTLGTPVILEGHTKAVTAVAWVGDRLFSGSRDGSVRQWTAAGAQVGQGPESVGNVNDLVPSLDGSLVLVASDAYAVVPIVVRYVHWLARVVTFDFDRSFIDNEPVKDKIAAALPITLSLNLLSIFLIYLVSVPLGIYAAVRRGHWFDRGSSVIVFMLYSMPSWWVATLLILGFSSARTLDWFPSVGLHDVNAADFTGLHTIGDYLMHLVLPVSAYVYGGFASLSRYVRTSMLEVIEQDYVRTARAKGLDEWTVVMGHAFRNALVVIVTLFGNLLPAMVGGSVIIEYIFSIQGMGLLGFNAILSRDYPVIMAITTMSAVLTLLGILVSDLLYGVVDPRVRVQR